MSEIKVYPTNKYKPCKFFIDSQGLIALLKMNKSGLSLYKFLLINGDKFLAADGIAYLNPMEMTQFLDCTRKSIYNGLEELLIRDILSRTGKPGEYFYNPKFFNYGING